MASCTLQIHHLTKFRPEEGSFWVVVFKTWLKYVLNHPPEQAKILIGPDVPETIEIKKSRSTSLNFKSEYHSGRKEISKLKCNRLQNNAIGVEK